jgi:hypothetical protein
MNYDIKNNLICQYCTKEFANKQNAHRHAKNCRLNPSHPEYVSNLKVKTKKFVVQKISDQSICQYCKNPHDKICVYDPKHHLYEYAMKYTKTCKSTEEIERFISYIQTLPINPVTELVPKETKEPVYFNVDFDLYKLLCELNGKNWAHNYLFYTIHNKPYINVISEYIVKPNIEQCPIRVKNKSLLVLYHSKDQIIYDPDWQIFINYLKNIIQNAMLQAWKSFNDDENINKASNLTYHINNLYELNNPLYEHEITAGKLYIEKIQNNILDGFEGRPSMPDLNKLYDKVAIPKLTLLQKKDFLSSLPKED